jgi:hypothetical protein
MSDSFAIRMRRPMCGRRYIRRFDLTLFGGGMNGRVAWFTMVERKKDSVEFDHLGPVGIVRSWSVNIFGRENASTREGRGGSNKNKIDLLRLLRGGGVRA